MFGKPGYLKIRVGCYTAWNSLLLGRDQLHLICLETFDQFRDKKGKNE